MAICDRYLKISTFMIRSLRYFFFSSAKKTNLNRFTKMHTEEGREESVSQASSCGKYQGGRLMQGILHYAFRGEKNMCLEVIFNVSNFLVFLFSNFLNDNDNSNIAIFLLTCLT